MRRRDLLLGFGSAALGACAPEPRNKPHLARTAPSESKPAVAVPTPKAPVAELPGGKSPENFVLYTRTPLTLETKRSKMGASIITPASLLFVRNNLPLPEPSIVEHRDEWTLSIAGVKKPGTLTLGELKRLGLTTIATVLQCSGNGRRYFEHGPSGAPWGTGAAGCVLWTGVPVANVIAALGGAEPDAHYLTATGGERLPELPKEIDPKQLLVERSIPRAKALADCLLAWEMNGEPLPLVHGGPLRLIVPGYYGVNNVKYVSAIALTRTETTAAIQAKGYRMRPIGQKGDPSQPSLWRMNVNSWIHGPGAAGFVRPGTTVFHGVAFSGERAIVKVEGSTDGGKTWKPARLVGPDLGANAWRQFAFEAQLEPGKYMVVSRATDQAGEVQPAERLENERGYANNSWRDHGLAIEATTAIPDALEEPVPPQTSAKGPRVLSDAGTRGHGEFLRADPPCGGCHTLEHAGVAMPIGPDLDQLAPTRERVLSALRQGVGAMPTYKGKLTDAQLEDLATYVVEATKRGT